MNKKIITLLITAFLLGAGIFIYKSSSSSVKKPTSEYRLMRVSKGTGKGYIDVEKC
ncbi:MAG: hypothetical protein ACLTQH_01280 [Fusobacterium sp.]